LPTASETRKLPKKVTREVADFSFGEVWLAEILAIQQWRWAKWRKLNPETAVWVDHHNDDGGVGQCDRDGRTGISGADGGRICSCERADNKVAIGVIPELLGPGSAVHRKPGPAHRRLKAGESRQASATAAASHARRRSVRQPGREGLPDRLICARGSRPCRAPKSRLVVRSSLGAKATRDVAIVENGWL
jgi:hypothetical protein